MSALKQMQHQDSSNLDRAFTKEAGQALCWVINDSVSDSLFAHRMYRMISLV